MVRRLPASPPSFPSAGTRDVYGETSASEAGSAERHWCLPAARRWTRFHIVWGLLKDPPAHQARERHRRGSRSGQQAAWAPSPVSREASARIPAIGLVVVIGLSPRNRF